MKLSYLCIAKLRLLIPFIGYIVPTWHTPNDGQTLPHVLRGVPKILVIWTQRSM